MNRIEVNDAGFSADNSCRERLLNEVPERGGLARMTNFAAIVRAVHVFD